MKITQEISITEFKAWSGAVETLDRIINENMASEFDALIEELYPDGIDETSLNDLLWFEEEWVYSSLGMSTEEEEEEDTDN